MADAASPAQLAAELGSSAPYVVQIVPELRERLPTIGTAAISPESEHARFYLFDATARFLKLAAEARPIVVVLDDLHWADKSSLLLEFLGREIRDAAILVIGTYREAEARQQSPLADQFAALVRLGRRVPLRGLGAADVATFIEQIGKTKPDAELVTAIHQATEGNPFFVDEIVRLMLAEGITVRPGKPLPIPDSVRAVIRRRLSLLPEETRRVLAVASVVGGEFDVALVERLVEGSSNELAELLMRATAAGIVARSGTSGRYAFAHALIRETLHEDLGVTERRRLHGEVGRAIEDLHRAALDSHLAELAYHFLDAGETGKAIDYAARAGRRASAAHAYEEACGYFERALRLLGEPEQRERCELLLDLGAAQSRAGDLEESRATLRRAAEVARRLGLPEHLARAAIASQRLHGAEPGIGTFHKEALEALPEGDSVIRAQMLAVRAWHVAGIDRAVADRLGHEAVDMARRLGEKHTLALALRALQEASFYSPNREQALALLAESQKLAEEIGDQEILLDVRFARIDELRAIGNVRAAAQELDSFERIAAELRQPFYSSLALFQRASIALAEGRFEESERIAQEGREVGRRSWGWGSQQFRATHVYLLRHQQGRLADMVDQFERAKRLMHGRGAVRVWRCFRAHFYAEIGNEAEARRELESLVDLNDYLDSSPSGLAQLGEAAVILGDLRRVARLYELLLPYERQVVMFASSTHGAASHYLGIMAAALSRFDEAARHFESALVLHAKIGARPFAARTHYHYAKMLLARAAAGDRDKARALAAQALRTAEELGMKKVAEEARALEGANEEQRFATDRLGGGVFVGRERELGELRSALGEAEHGRGSLFLVSGEPGIGKTRLADRLCGIAAGGGFRVVWGRAWEGEGAPAFWPWVQILRSLAEAATPAELAAQMGSGAAYVVRLAPELVEKLPSIPPAATSPESEHARFYLFDAMARFLKKAAQSRPLVLVLDDLQWADKPSLLLLEFLAREVADSRLLLIGTYREAEARQGGPLSDILAALARQAHPLPLRGLGEAEVAALMEAIGKGAPDPRLVAAVRRASDGNPFFVDEIVRLLAAEGITQQSDQRPLPIPDSVRAVIRRRLAALPTESRRVFALASVIGPEFDGALLERVCGLAANELAETLSRAATAGILTRAPGPHGRYGFAHSLIRETLYDDLGANERPQLHAAIGRALEDLAGPDVDARLAELAHHFLHSAAADVEKAIDYSTRAGRRGMAMHGYEEAAGHFERALQAPSLQRDERRRCELSILLGEAQNRAGGVKRSLETLSQAIELAEHLDLPEELARAALAFGSTFGTDLTRRALLEKALDALPETDSLLRARVLARLAVNLLYEGSRAGRGMSLIDEAVAMAGRLGDRLTLAQTLTMRRAVQWLSPAHGERFLPSPEESRLVEETRDKELGIELQYVRIRALLTRGDVGGARREVDAYCRMAEELREPAYLNAAELHQASLDIIDGRLEEADRRLQHAREVARRGGFLQGRQAVGVSRDDRAPRRPPRPRGDALPQCDRPRAAQAA